MVAAATLFGRIRKRIDLENTAYLNDQVELGPLCEESYFDLWDFLLATMGDEGPWTRDTSLSTAASSESVNVPSSLSVYRILRIDFRGSAGLSYVPIMRGNIATDPLDSVARPWGTGANVRYYARRALVGKPAPNYFTWTLYFDPIPTQVHNLRLFFMPCPTVGHDGSNYISFPDEWPEYVVADVCAKLAAKQEGDTAPFEAERERVRTRIERYTRPLNQSQPSFIADQRRYQAEPRDDIGDGFWERR